MKCMKINEFIELLQNEFDFLEKERLFPDNLLYNTFGSSSLNLLFLRSLIDENFGVNLSDKEIKECRTINDLYTKIQSHLEDKPSQ